MNFKTMFTILAVMFCSPALAQSGGCAIKQAAEQAQQKQIALLDATKVNPDDFFNGASSCINPQLLSQIDLSSLIQTGKNFLQANIQSTINGLIQKVQQQVCEKLNDQLSDVMSKINENLFNFESLAGKEVSELLNQGGSFSPVTAPNIEGVGKYNFIERN